MLERLAHGRALIGAAFAAALLLTGCETTNGPSASGGSFVTATDTAQMTRSGFLTDYARLRPTSWGNGVECWRDPTLNARKYTKVLFSRIVVSLAPPKAEGISNTVDPTDLKTLTDYFHAALVKAVRPEMPVATTAGPGVLVIRIALTDLVPTSVSESLAGTLIPYGFVAEAGSGVATGRPAGSTPYMGAAGMEMQFRDGATGKVVGECRDTEIGRKYALADSSDATQVAETWVNGYLSSFDAWSYARAAFDKWSALLAQRIAALRGQ